MPFDGKLGELIVLEDATEESRQKFEGYLAHKGGLTDKLPNDHPYKSEFNPTYNPPTPISGLYDLSGNGNHATQSALENQPGLRLSGLNGKNIVEFDGNDFLTFERAINSIRSLFIVAKRVCLVIVDFYLVIRRIMVSKLGNPPCGNSLNLAPRISMTLTFPNSKVLRMQI